MLKARHRTSFQCMQSVLSYHTGLLNIHDFPSQRKDSPVHRFAVQLNVSFRWTDIFKAQFLYSEGKCNNISNNSFSAVVLSPLHIECPTLDQSSLYLQRLPSAPLHSFHGNLSPWRCKGAPSLPEPAAHPAGPDPPSGLHQLTLHDEIIRGMEPNQ